MVLSYNTLKEITKGIVTIDNNCGEFSFNRFTDAQYDLLHKQSADNDDYFYNRGLGTACVRLAFKTNSEHLGFDYRLTCGSSRQYAGFDIYENGFMKYHFYIDDGMPQQNRINVKLSKGEKVVELFLPFSKKCFLSNITLDDDCIIKPISRKFKMISFGDSITQGYDSIHPSLSYVNRLTMMLDADCLNQGIGGHCFTHQLVDNAINYNPDIVTVAYGTNDWTKFDSYQIFADRCKDFFKSLYSKYPNAKIVVITPLWRVDNEMSNTKIGIPHSQMHNEISNICSFIPNVKIINGYEVFPHISEFFYDERIHPNDLGFGIYASNIYKQIHI